MVNIGEAIQNRVDGIKAEFKKIIWPDQKTVTRETIAVVAAGVGLSLIITLLDTVIKFGLGFIL